MTKEQILNAFLQAEKDWSAPIEKSKENHTQWGLCHYFYFHIRTERHDIEHYLMPLWVKYRTHFNSRIWDFILYGDHPKGRAERLDAIRKVIQDLKTESND